MARILIVEDDAVLADMLEDCLRRDLLVVERADNGQDAHALLGVSEFDVIVMDWDLPGKSGLDVITDYRSRGGSAPVLMLTGKSTIDDKEQGFMAGSDDYLTKPFDPKEFRLRIRALLRRSSVQHQAVLTLGALVLDPEKFIATMNGSALDLTAAEFRLLEFFMRYPGSVFSAEAILTRVWSSESEATINSVRICITRLRAKLKEYGSSPSINTIYNAGYSLVV